MKARKLLGVLITVCMIVSCMVGFTVTADAAPSTLTVCDGTNTRNDVPVKGADNDQYQRAQSVYPATALADMNGKNITKLCYYLADSAANTWEGTYQVYITETAADSISEFQAPGTKVYEGALNGTGDTMEITLSTAYKYNGGNLLITVQTAEKGENWSGADFSCIESTDSSIYGYHSSGLDSIINASVVNFLPKLTFTYSLPSITTWAELKAAMAAGGTIILTQNITAETSDTYLSVPSGKTVTLDLNGKTIDRNLSVATDDGYVIKNSGTLTIKDSGTGGTITGGNNTGYGGGINNENGSTLTLQGGSITGNSARWGGGVNNDGLGAEFTMTGGSITNNSATDNGGGVYNYYNGTFTMSDGIISGNESDMGGGVYNDASSIFTMSGGSIKQNSAADDGGGVHNSGAFTMSGGVITQNSATNDGSGVDSVGVFSIKSGSAITITGNKKGTIEHNVYLHLSNPIIVTSVPTTGSEIGVTTYLAPTEEDPVNITDSFTGSAAFLTSDNPNYYVNKKDGNFPAVLMRLPTIAAPVISGTTPFTDSTTVTITCETDGVVIYYTTDGTDPADSATRDSYDEPFTLNETTTVKAIAKQGMGTAVSEVASKTFTKGSGGNNDDPENNDPENNDPENNDPENNNNNNVSDEPWAEKPEYKPSGASGTNAPEETPAPADNDKQDVPQDRDNDRDIDDDNDNDIDKQIPGDDGDDGDKDDDTTEIPEDKDTANDGTSTVVDGSKDTNENPHTGAALGGLAIVTLAGAAIIVSKKRK